MPRLIAHLVSPLQDVALPVLQTAVERQKLLYADLVHQRGVLLGVGPRQWLAF